MIVKIAFKNRNLKRLGVAHQIANLYNRVSTLPKMLNLGAKIKNVSVRMTMLQENRTNRLENQIA